MATKTISITEEAYSRLKSLKREKESFSQVINRVSGKHKLREIFGVLSGKAGGEFEKSILESRRKHRKARYKRMEKIRKELGV
jgi:predicted CopG family antitoxin